MVVKQLMERIGTDTLHFYVTGYSPLALPLGVLSPKVTERVLQPYVPSPSSLRSATSPKGRGKGAIHYPTVPVNGLMHPAYLPAPVFLSEFGVFPNGYKYVTITAHICGEAVADGL